VVVKQLMNTSLKKASEKEKTAVLRLEMDYELATLFEAIEEKNEKKMKECKQKLEKIRLELLRLKAF
jgi:NAD(P)H-nitrite reductase large subunit